MAKKRLFGFRRVFPFLCFAACGGTGNLKQPGLELPDFSLLDDRGNTVTRADLLGHKTVLWFYPKAATPG